MIRNYDNSRLEKENRELKKLVASLDMNKINELKLKLAKAEIQVRNLELDKEYLVHSHNIANKELIKLGKENEELKQVIQEALNELNALP